MPAKSALSIGSSIGIGIADIVVTEFIRWQQIKARDAAWKPSEADKAEFLAYIQNDTTERIEAEVAAEQGKTWADRQPPKPESDAGSPTQ